MRCIVQRVSHCSITINEQIKSKIGGGLFILLGIENTDGVEDIAWLCAKIVNMRIFGDENNLMNLSIKDTGGDILLVSQFTLHASTKKGNRPSFIKAAKPAQAIPLYEQFIKQMETDLCKEIYTGEFGADMQIELLNNGPVSIIIDSKNKE